MRDKIAKQHNAVTQAKYQMSGLELNLFACLIAMTDLETEDRQKVTIRISDIESLAGKRYRIQDYDQACAQLHTRTAVIDFNGKRRRYNLVITSELDDECRQIQLEMHPDIRPWFINLDKYYTYYQLSMTLKLPSKYSKRIYQMVCQYRRTGVMKIGLEELKERLGVRSQDQKTGEWEDLYSVTGKFQQRVLNKACEDINDTTDMQVSYKPLKTGKKTTAYQFNIQHRPNQYTIPFEGKEVPPKGSTILVGSTKLPYPAGSPPEVRLPAYRLSPWQVKRILENFDKREIGKILYAVDLAISDKKVSNLGAYTAPQFEKHRAVGIYKNLEVKEYS